MKERKFNEKKCETSLGFALHNGDRRGGDAAVVELFMKRFSFARDIFAYFGDFSHFEM